MGEEAAGIDAVRIALARIASGQSDIALVGAAHNGERKDLLMLYEFGDFNLKETFAPVWSRGDRGGFALGSGGVFLVIESNKHALSRGAKPFARSACATASAWARTCSSATTSAARPLPSPRANGPTHLLPRASPPVYPPAENRPRYSCCRKQASQ